MEFVQNKAPKVTASDLSPASWEKDRDEVYHISSVFVDEMLMVVARLE